MLRLAFSLITIIIFSLPFITVFNYKIGKSLPLSYIMMSLVMFICALLNNFSLYKYLFPSLDIIILIYVFINFNKYKERIINNLFRISLLIFAIAYIYLYFALREKMYIHIDEYYYWGKLVRDSVINNSLFSSNNSVSIGSYPPFYPILEILFCKLLGNINEIEGYSIFAISSFSLSLFMLILDKFNFDKNTNLKVFVSSLIIIASTLLISTNDNVRSWNLYNTILLDWSLGYLLGYCLYLSINSDTNLYDSISFGLCCFALIMSKQVSLPLCVLVLAIYYISLLVKKKIRWISIIPFAMATILYIIWQIKMTFSNSILPVSSSITTLSNATNTINSEYSISIIKKFVNAFFTRPIHIHPIGISYFAVILFSSLLIFLFGKYKKDRKYYVLGIFIFLGGIGYALVILFTYIAGFAEYEGLSLASYGRYMQTYTIASLVLLIFLFTDIIDKLYQYLIMLFVICMFVEPTSINELKIQKQEDNLYYKFRNTISNFYNYTYKNEKITLLYSYNGTGVNLIKYICDIDNSDIIEFNTIATNDDTEKFLSSLKDSKYLIVVDSTDSFWINCGIYFQDGLILNQTIYYIDYDENGKVLLMRL